MINQLPKSLDKTEDHKRLQELLSFEVLDTDYEREYDEIVNLASEICEVPIALISLVDDTRQWFKAKVGLSARETPKEISFCQYAIREDKLFQVYDASKSPFFKDNPLVMDDPNIRFYAGMPLTSSHGLNVGTLCVIDTQPKKLNALQEKALEVLSNNVIRLLENRKSNEELKSLRAFFNLQSEFAQVIGLCNWRFNVQNQSLELNDEWFKLIGYERHEIEHLVDYEWWRANIHPNDIEATEAKSKLLFEGKIEKFENQYRRKHKDGSWIWVLDRGKVLEWDENRIPKTIIGAHINISERKAQEHRMKSQERRFSSIVEGINLCTWEFNFDKKVFDVNDKGFALVGYTREEMEPVTFAKWKSQVHPDDFKKVMQKMDEHFHGKTDHYQCEYRRRHKKGHWVWVLDTGRLLSKKVDGSPKTMFGAHVDITDRKIDQELIEEQRLINEIVIDNVPDMLFMKDLESKKYVEVNASFNRILGVDQKDFLGKTDHEIFSKEVADKFVDDDRKAVLSSSIQEIFETIQDSSGKTVNVKTRKIPIFDKKGQAKFLLGISEDITEKLKQEEEIRMANQKLRRYTKELEQFAYIATHDIKSPISNLEGFLELVELDLGETSKEITENLNWMKSSIEDVKTVIEDLTNALRARDDVSQTVESINLTKFFQELIQRHNKEILDKEATVSVDVEDTPSVNYYIRALTSILENLLSNSLKYNDPKRPLLIEISSRSKEGNVIISVKDNGVGINLKRDKEKLFNLFQRINQSAKGSGMGMFIVLKLLENYGGEIRVESKLNVGSTFHIELPDLKIDKE
ncbi:MAG: PAS domain-containing protein [Flavobacteriales bacterium]|nr:PAS domain-containing protein [Flavobacteriales bacterium]